MNSMLRNSLVTAAMAGMLVGSAALAEEKTKGKKVKKVKKDAVEKPAEKAAEADKVADKAAEVADKKIHCFGINSCKGKSECAIDGSHGCSGANSCQGKGWITMTLKECNDKHGKVVN